jgi:GNAT superfamily N-acetyltransferase
MSTVTVRAPEGADAARVATLLAGVVPGPSETAEELGADLPAWPAGDAWVLDEGDRLAGFATVRRRGALIADGDLVALPGSEQPLVELIERRAADWRAPVLRVTPRGSGSDLAGLGYRLVRTFLRLGVDSAAFVPPAEAPAELLPVEPADPRLYQLEQTCFAASWGFVPETYPQWRDRVGRRPPAPSFVALAAGEAIGGIYCTYRYGWGWVRSLVVAPAARGRGVGAQLLGAAAAALDASRLGLEVDELNEPARRLYERAGLRELDRERFYEKELRA